MSSKAVKIRIVTKLESGLPNDKKYVDEISRYTEDGESVADMALECAELPVMDGIAAESDGPTMTEVKGQLTEQNGEITLEYYTHLSSLLPTYVKYMFYDNKRDVLTVSRSSMGERVYFFENKNKRQTVVCDTDNTSFELGIYTKSLKNFMTYENGGYIEIEYYAEMKGGLVEHCREYVLAEPIK